MRGDLLLEDTLATVVLLLFAFGIAIGGILTFIFMSNAQENAAFRLTSFVSGTTIHSGLLKYRVSGDSIAEIAVRSVAAGSFENSGTNPSTLKLHLSRIFSIVGSETKVEFSTGYKAGGISVYCGSDSVAAYCEYGESGCSIGRTECTGSDCDAGKCPASSICCREISYKIHDQEYETVPGLPYCEGRKGICEAISCAPGREKIPITENQSAEGESIDGTCENILAKIDQQTVPIAGIENPFVCCQPIRKEDLRKTVERTDAPKIEIPILSPGDQKMPGGYMEKIIIGS